MSIPLEHLEGLVSRNGRDLHGVQSLLKEPRGRLMAQIMEGQALDASGFAGCGKGAAYRRRVDTENTAIELLGQALQNRYSGCGQWYPPRRPVLGLREQKNARLTIPVFPPHGDGLPPTHGGLYRPRDGKGDLAITIALSGRQETGLARRQRGGAPAYHRRADGSRAARDYPTVDGCAIPGRPR